MVTCLKTSTGRVLGPRPRVISLSNFKPSCGSTLLQLLSGRTDGGASQLSMRCCVTTRSSSNVTIDHAENTGTGSALMLKTELRR